MNVMILGGDGYLGWPTMMYFAQQGHNVIGIDNYLKRKFATEVNEQPLFPILTLQERVKYWNSLPTSKTPLQCKIGDITNFEFLYQLIEEFKPTCVVHYAEQPSAPWSMFNYQNARRTVENNLIGTLNLAWAVKELNRDIHIIKLGTSGEYSNPNTAIPADGFLKFEYKDRTDTRLFPREGPSIYHTTKIQDTDLLWLFCRMWKLRVTDLMQGPVLGMAIDEMNDDPKLDTAFHYGEHFGTVLNRFVIQALCGYPLTIYGKGGQARGYINIKDTVQCIHLAATNPIESGHLRILHQMTETFKINELAQKVIEAGNELGIEVKSQNVPNPRIENENVEFYEPEYSPLFDLGLNPTLLTTDIIKNMMKTAADYIENVNIDTFYNNAGWRV